MKNTTKPVAIPVEPFPFIWHITRESWVWAVTAVAFVCLAVILEGVVQYVIKILVDTVSDILNQPGTSFRSAWFWAIMYPTLVFLCNWSRRGSGFAGMRWITGCESASYRVLFEHLTGHSARFFQSRFAGSLSNKISNASSGTEELLFTFLWSFLPTLATLATNLVLAFAAHPLVAAVSFGWMAVIIVINAFMVRPLSRLSFDSASSSSDLKGKIVDTSTNMSVVQQYSRIPYERKYVGGYIEGYRGKHLGAWRASEWVLVLNNFLIASFILSTVVTALMLLQQGRISIGSMVMVIFIIGGIHYSLTFLSMTATQAIQSYGQIKEGLAELLLPHEVVDVPDAPELKVQRGLIEFKEVRFAYNETPVIDKLSLSIAPAQKIGLVGRSGAGKSTLVSLLLRQYDLQQGEISIDGQPICGVTQASLRRSIAVVPQDVTLFHRSIADNIRYGRIEASDQELKEAARLALADDFIAQMPQGYETYVGERGIKLSGGQRQRIAIAR
ncbi:MAG: ABC transporter ATP-binding protein, partial [Deltaproteobacteria bacterium]|nr:ABC transporter ATP-binding protein [Deltaproteobacteria bacterium]